MSPTKNPLDQFEEFFDRMSRDFQEASRFWKDNGDILNKQMENVPSLDIIEKDNKYIITTELPGFEKDEIEIELIDNGLEINAEHTEQKQEEEGNIIKKERSAKSQRRYLKLPEEIKQEEIDATLKNGVLTIEIPKKTKTKQKTKKIDIKT